MAGTGNGSRAGAETQRALLALGAGCLVVAVTAGTALIWPALGVSGQTAVMVAATAAAFAVALRLVRLAHLRATAEAVATVAVVAVGVDVVAGRRLLLASVSPDVSRGYWIAACAAAAVVLWLVAARPSRLVAPAMGAVAAVLAVGVAAVAPQTAEDLAVLGPIGLALAVAMWQLADVSGARADAVRLACVAGGACSVMLGEAAALVAAVDGSPLLWCGVAVAAAFAARRATAMPAGAVAAVLLVAGGVVPAVDRPALAAVLAAPLLVAVWPWGAARWLAGLALVVEVVAQVAAQAEVVAGHRGAGTGSALLVLAAAVVALHGRRDQLLLTPLLLIPLTTVETVALTASHRAVPEAYLAAPAIVLLAGAAVGMWRRPSLSSASLLPGLVVALLPATLLAVHGDVQRQVAVLGVATLVVLVGAMARLAAPLQAGGVALAMVSLSVLGPQIVLLPRWLALGIVGVVLLTVGGTWERRLQQLQTMTERVRPAVAVLR